MVSIGPYIPHPDTPLGTRCDSEQNLDPTSLIRAVLDAIAVSRVMVPYAHIPATTALGVLGKKDKGWIEFGRRYVSAYEPESVGIACFEEGCAGLETWNDPRALALMCGDVYKRQAMERAQVLERCFDLLQSLLSQKQARCTYTTSRVLAAW